ncbi:MAG: ABC transporter ATP-binding protein [Acidobacteria bacterium]|nr:ABC transporter ATP-binding protein [Acidobacteriota bacterium]
MALIEIDQVVKQYQDRNTAVRALDGVSLTAEAGEFVSLVGRSGCGKTTLLNLAGAMDFPTAGIVRLDGQSTTGLGDKELTRIRREKVGFVFQFFQLLPTLTAAENVELPLQLAGERDVRGRALERLALVELDGLADRYPHQLSGGQMQRVAIARAIVHKPKLLLADEPIGNLDSASADVVMQLLRRVADELGAAILMATHSLEAAKITDTLIRLRDGRIEERRPVAA